MRKSSKIVLGATAHWNNPKSKPEWWTAPWLPIEEANREDLMAMMENMCFKGIVSNAIKLLKYPADWPEVPIEWKIAQEKIRQSQHVLCIGAGTEHRNS